MLCVFFYCILQCVWDHCRTLTLFPIKCFPDAFHRGSTSNGHFFMLEWFKCLFNNNNNNTLIWMCSGARFELKVSDKACPKKYFEKPPESLENYYSRSLLSTKKYNIKKWGEAQYFCTALYVQSPIACSDLVSTLLVLLLYYFMACLKVLVFSRDVYN